MLKTIRDGQTWLVSQPDHGQMAGFLAAHWGNDQFSRMGHFADPADPEALGEEAIFGVAEHDNGWWEWEASPELGEADGVPLGLTELLRDHRGGMNRFRAGIERFSEARPFASLLISFHAYWLYAHGCLADPDPAFTHPLFWRSGSTRLMGDRLDISRGYMAEIETMQSELTERLRADPASRDWIEPENLNPHVRLLQLLDGLSLSLCSSLVPPSSGVAAGLGCDEFDLLGVPRRSWDDRVTIEVRPVGERRIACEPYPFDVDPLPVTMPTRIIETPSEPPGRFESWWHSTPKQLVGIEYCSA